MFPHKILFTTTLITKYRLTIEYHRIPRVCPRFRESNDNGLGEGVETEWLM